MRTSKPISTISYNSEAHLSTVFDGLVKARVLSFWCAVQHHGETLEDGTVEKDHWHVYAEPNKPVDTMDLQIQSKEFDPKNPEKPLKCIDFRSSKWDEWVWYTQHDPWYLATKVEHRQYQYGKEDYIFSDEDEFDYRWQRAIHSSAISGQKKIRALLEQTSASELAYMGLIQPQEAFQYAAFEKLVFQGRIDNERALGEQKRIEDEKKRRKQLADPIPKEVQAANDKVRSEGGFMPIPEDEDLFA